MSQVRKDVLNGWKEIAAYLGRDPRTVERWEKQRSLPVRRLPGSGRASVYALVSELDAWLMGTAVQGDKESEPEEPIPSPDVPDDLPVTAASEGVLSEPLSPEPLPKPSSSEPVPSEPSVEAGTTPNLSVAGEQSPRPRFLPAWLRWSAGLLLIGSLAYGSVRLAAGRLRQPPIGSSSPRAFAAPSSRVPGVDDLCLRGAYQVELRTAESLQHGQAAYTEAIRRDPKFAPAYAGLAVTYVLEREYALLPDTKAFEEADAAATEALMLDPKLPEAYAVQGFVDFVWHWDAYRAEEHFATALRLDPGLALGHHWYGSMLTHEGRYQEALRELEYAQNLQPGSPSILTTRAFALGLSGRRDQAISLLDDAITSEHQGPYRNPATMHRVLATLCLLPPRNLQRYVSERLLADQLRGDMRGVQEIQFAARRLQMQGEAQFWQALLDEEHRQHPDGPTFDTAAFEAEVGRTHDAERDLEALYRRHDPALIGMTIDPSLHRLDGDGAFQHLQAEMHLRPGSY